MSNIAASISRYQSYAELDPENALLWRSLGDLYHQSGQSDQAKIAYEKSLALQPDNTVAQGRLANLCITKHDFSAAERLLQQLVQTDTSPALHYNLALSLYYQRRWSESQTLFEQTANQPNLSEQSLYYLSSIQHNLGNIEQAIVICNTLIKQHPTDKAKAYLAMLEMDNGNLEVAYHNALDIIKREPDNADASAVLGNYFATNQDMEKAQYYFDSLAKKESDNPRGWFGQGLVALYQQKHDQAIDLINKSITFMPNNVGAYVTLAWVYVAKKDFITAEKTFLKSIEVNRNFGEAHGGLACALVFQNKVDQAKQEIKIALGLNPKGFGAIFAQSIILKLRNQGQRSQQMLATLLEQSPQESGRTLIESIQHYAQEQHPISQRPKQLIDDNAIEQGKNKNES